MSGSENGDGGACSPDPTLNDQPQSNNIPPSVACVGFQACVADDSQEEAKPCSSDHADINAEERPVLPSKDSSIQRWPGPQVTQLWVIPTSISGHGWTDAERTAQSVSNATEIVTVQDVLTVKNSAVLSTHNRLEISNKQEQEQEQEQETGNRSGSTHLMSIHPERQQ